MNKIKDWYCRFIMYLFLRSHRIVVVARRNGKFLVSGTISDSPAVVPADTGTLEVAFVPIHRGQANLEKVWP